MVKVGRQEVSKVSRVVLYVLKKKYSARPHTYPEKTSVQYSTIQSPTLH